MMAPLLECATVGKTHGTDGYVRVYSLSGEYAHLKKISSCLVRLPSGEELALTVEDAVKRGDLFLMKFSEYPTPEKARFLAKSSILIKREDAPKLKKGEFYVADLYGMDVMCEGKKVGTVKCTAEGGQALLLVVMRTDNGKEYLVPNLPQFVSNISLEDNCLSVVNPQLLDLS